MTAADQQRGASLTPLLGSLTKHATGAYSYQQIAEHFGLHFTTVGGIVRGGG